MEQYLNLARQILARGAVRPNRTGVDTLGIFGYQMRFDLREGFPIVTTKRLHWRSIAYELLWFLRGDTNVAYLHRHGVRIWDEWANANGDLGPIYGKQWRAWQCADGRVVDQVREVIREIRQNPDSRRLMISAWNVGDLPQMALPPCHVMLQLYVQDGYLSGQLYQRSADVFLGVPFNIASYALLIHLIAHTTGLKAGEFVHTIGDAHIYQNHIEAMRMQLRRDPHPLPQLQILCGPKPVEEYDFKDFRLEGYVAHPHIAGQVAV